LKVKSFLRKRLQTLERLSLSESHRRIVRRYLILKKCPHCSAVNADEDSVCGICGSSLANATPVNVDEAPKAPGPSAELNDRTELVETGAAGLLRECPFCHKHFAAELVSREHVDTGELEAVDFPMVRPPMRGLSSGLRPVTEVYVTSKFNYRCMHCGREWSRIATHEYVGE